MSTKSVIEKLLKSNEQAVRLKTYLRLLNHDYETSEVKKLTTNLKKNSPIIKSLFSYLPKDDTSKTYHVYTKWQGAHWILSQLADIGYPPGDKTLIPSINREMKWLMGRKLKLVIDGRNRFCASQDGNGIYSAISLGFFDERSRFLVDRLVEHQWNDGGWNCDRKPEAINSSYHESLIPLRALNLYLKKENNSKIKKAVDHTIELFLKRNLYRRISDGKVINKKWLILHYPPYWHYDILMALKVLGEADKLMDKRCNEALDLLESKRLEDGGFPKEAKYCQSTNPNARYYTPADWKGVDNKTMNKWVTIDSLYILKKANRIDID
ncbi:MAG: hypothetical protein ACFFDS_04880 [Candidatus Thorarchaeota archaeon]